MQNFSLISTFRLVYFLHPSDWELRKLAGLPQPKPKAKPKPEEENHRRHKNKRKWEEPKEDNTFTVPRNLDIQVSIVQFSYVRRLPVKLSFSYSLKQLKSGKTTFCSSSFLPNLYGSLITVCLPFSFILSRR